MLTGEGNFPRSGADDLPSDRHLPPQWKDECWLKPVKAAVH